MKRKYAGYYYSVKKEVDGWIWKIFGNYFDKKPMLSSLDNKEYDERYLSTETEARTDAIHAIQDHY